MIDPYDDPTQYQYWLTRASVCAVLDDPRERMIAIAEDLAEAYVEGSRFEPLPSQVEAARLLIKMLEEDGEEVPDDIRRVANG